jgi:DNA-binding GntR family transcriptional regulator
MSDLVSDKTANIAAIETLAPKRLTRSIYEEIRNRICLLKYPPGYVIRENELAREFGMSRTPVREVLQKLEHEGFVKTKNGFGTIVTGVDFTKLRDVYDLRLKLAELIGELSPRTPNNNHREMMQGLLERAKRLRDDRNTEEFWRVNHERQGIISSLIGNEALRELYDSYYYRTSRVWYEVVGEIWNEQIDALCTELADLTRALTSGDARAVAYVERNHLSYYMIMLGRFVGGQLRSQSAA